MVPTATVQPPMSHGAHHVGVSIADEVTVF